MSRDFLGGGIFHSRQGGNLPRYASSFQVTSLFYDALELLILSCTNFFLLFFVLIALLPCSFIRSFVVVCCCTTAICMKGLNLLNAIEYQTSKSE